MTRSLLKLALAAVPALLAGAAQAIHFTNDIPVDAYYEAGTEFVLEWDKETREDTFTLSVGSFLAEPILVSPDGGPLGSPVYDYKNMDVILDDALKFTAQNYTWTIATIDGREGSEWYYRFGATYDLGASYPRAFHVKTSS